jgi:hypothetical protein
MITSAMMLRAELCVQRNRTLNALSLAIGEPVEFVETDSL